VTKIAKLTLNDARDLVLSMIANESGGYVRELGLANMLDKYVVEKEHCWIFFRSKAFSDAPRMDVNDCNWGAFAIGHDGACQQIFEFRDDPIRQEEYEQRVSEFMYRQQMLRERITRDGDPRSSAQKIPPGDEGSENID
jgi:hypothetical protein